MARDFIDITTSSPRITMQLSPIPPVLLPLHGLETLPLELYLQILFYFPHRDRWSLRLVSKHLKTHVPRPTIRDLEKIQLVKSWGTGIQWDGEFFIDRHPFIRRPFGAPHFNGLVMMDRRDRWHEEHEGLCPGECSVVDVGQMTQDSSQGRWLVCHGCVCLRPAEKFGDTERLGLDRVVGGAKEVLS